MIVLMKWKRPRKQDKKHWQEITIERAIDLLEGSGRWKKDTVADMLTDGALLWDTLAYYKKKGE